MTLPSPKLHRLRAPLAAAEWGFAISVAVLAPLIPAWIAGKTFASRDTLALYEPVRGLIGEALRSGHLPLWNPFVITGMPLFAEMVHGVLHPISVACAFLLPGDGVDPLIAGYIAAAGVGAGVLARTLGASRMAATGAAVAYALSGFTLSMASNLVFLAGAGTVPWAVAALVAFARNPSPGLLAGGAAAVAASAISGDVQATIVGVALATALAADAAGPRGALRVGPPIGLGLLIAGVQLVTSWHHLALTDRGAGPAWDSAQWSFAPWRIVELVSPGFFAQPDAGLDSPVFVALADPKLLSTPFAFSVFVGLPVLAFAFMGVRPRRTGVVLGAAAVALLWAATGDRFGADRVLALIPIVRGLRYTEKYLGPVTLCLSMLAALGFDRVAREPRVARRLAVAAGGAGVAALVVRAALGGTGGQWLLAGVPDGQRIALHLRSGLVHAVVAAVALTGCGLAFARGRTRSAGGAAAAVLWAAGAAASPYAVRPGPWRARVDVSPPDITAPPPGPRLLHLHGMIPRTPAPGFDAIDQQAFDFRAVVFPNDNVRYRIDALGVDTGLHPLRYVALRGALGRAWSSAARRYGVTHVVFPTPRTEEGRAMAAEATAGAVRLAPEPRTGAEIWAVPHRPWASFPGAVLAVSDQDSAVETVGALHDAGREDVVVETGAAVHAAPGRVLSLSRDVEEVLVEAEADGDGLLVLQDAYWPGWRASIDGEEVPLYAADVLVRAVPFPTGRHVLVMRYDPPEVKWGVWSSLVGAVALGATCLVLAARRRVARSAGRAAGR